MNNDEDHLNNLLPEARDFLGKTDEERIDFAKIDKFIMYTTAEKIILKLEELRKEPKKTRMPCLLIIGESDNGKTSVVQKFHRMHSPTDGMRTIPAEVILITAPSGPDVHQFYDAILQELLIPFKKSDSLSTKEMEIMYHFTNLGVRLLIVDDINNILSGSVPKQQLFMNAVKNLSSKLSLPIVLVGIKTALHATETDMQISSRFRPMLLPLWKLDADYVSLLASMEQTLPLKKPSNLARNRELAEAILDFSEGFLGEITRIIKDSAMRAIESGRERITIEEVKQCADKPSERRGLKLAEGR